MDIYKPLKMKILKIQKFGRLLSNTCSKYYDRIFTKEIYLEFFEGIATVINVKQYIQVFKNAI